MADECFEGCRVVQEKQLKCAVPVQVIDSMHSYMYMHALSKWVEMCMLNSRRHRGGELGWL